MRIFSKRTLREFWESRQHDSQVAERDLSAWLRTARGAVWKDFGELKQTFGKADQVGNCVVFNVGSNRFRLIGRVNYQAGKLYVLRIMDHEEYDRVDWRGSCRCHMPPPRLEPPKPGPPTMQPKRGRKK